MTTRLVLEIDLDESDFELEEDDKLDESKVSKDTLRSVKAFVAEDGEVLDSFFHDNDLPTPHSVRVKELPNGNLIGAAQSSLAFLKRDLATMLKDHCLLDEHLQPKLDSLQPPEAEPLVREVQGLIAQLESALSLAEVESPDLKWCHHCESKQPWSHFEGYTCKERTTS